jgi:hypothetical protein
MAIDVSGIDFDRIIPYELFRTASQCAREERAENQEPDTKFESSMEAAAFMKRLWKTGRTLRIAFIDDHLQPVIRDRVHDRVEHYAGQWLEHANLHFEFDSPRKEAEIRIAFDPGLGNWSYVGTDALVFDDSQITMNLGELSRDPAEERYQHLILHEFGHALGLIHEHQSPESSIEWNKQAVINVLSGPPNYWSTKEIAFNVFIRYDKSYSQYADVLPEGTDFDPGSIMIYPIPSDWTVGGHAYQINSDLSETDKAFIARCYPEDVV